jgi:hypothetical protein
LLAGTSFATAILAWITLASIVITEGFSIDVSSGRSRDYRVILGRRWDGEVSRSEFVEMYESLGGRLLAPQWRDMPTTKRNLLGTTLAWYDYGSNLPGMQQREAVAILKRPYVGSQPLVITDAAKLKVMQGILDADRIDGETAWEYWEAVKAAMTTYALSDRKLEPMGPQDLP